MTQYAFFFDGKRCTGCKTCELACKDYNDLPADYAYRRICEYGGGSWSTDENGFAIPDVFTYYVSVACNHCDDPACTKVCPTGAMHKDGDTGLVSVDTDKCIGCGYCHMACPYNAPKVDRSKGHSVKCDGCASRVSAGKQSICVEACPMRALQFGPVDEMEALGERGNIAPLPKVEHTQPNLFIKPSKHACPAESGLGSIVNELEVI